MVDTRLLPARFKHAFVSVNCAAPLCRKRKRAPYHEIVEHIADACAGDFPRWTMRRTNDGVDLFCPRHCHMGRDDA